MSSLVADPLVPNSDAVLPPSLPAVGSPSNSSSLSAVILLSLTLNTDDCGRKKGGAPLWSVARNAASGRGGIAQSPDVGDRSTHRFQPKGLNP